MSDDASALPRRNRRVRPTREQMLDAAVESLASGDPEAASTIRIAAAIGGSWGTIKYHFGDIDGLWAALLRHIAKRRGALPGPADAARSTTRDRVHDIVEQIYRGLAGPDWRAVENLRSVLPRERAELAEHYPQTANELSSWAPNWTQACRRAFADLDVDPDRVDHVAAFLPGALSGLLAEEQRGGISVDLGGGRLGLAEAITAYLEHSG
ncbi:MAG: TetR/AcrR family transcriptional regulator [Gordonia sp. (in: high G+C Gram-positive bacteria)]